jgi:AraC-like DNA-binding protein
MISKLMHISFNPSNLLASQRIGVDFAPMGINNLVQIGRINYARASNPLDEHSHGNAMEICYLARGRQQYRVGGETFLMRGGDVFLAYPGERHDTGGAPEEKSILYWLLVDLEIARGGFLDYRGEEGNSIRRALKTLPERLFTGSNRMEGLLDQVILINHCPTPFLHTRTRALITEFLLETIGCGTNAVESRSLPGIQATLTEIRDRVEENVQLEDLAATAGLSLSHFKRVFRNEVGIPPREFILREKINKARSLLATGEMSITAVAFALSFSSSAYFSTAFKRFCNQSPSEFVKENSKRPA